MGDPLPKPVKALYDQNRAVLQALAIKAVSLDTRESVDHEQFLRRLIVSGPPLPKPLIKPMSS
jgi:hypothetical protein